VRLELGQVDCDNLVVLGALVRLQQVVWARRAVNSVGLDCDGSAESRSKVRVVRSRRVREDTGGSTNLGALRMKSVVV
jgi:hypothetical protein